MDMTTWPTQKHRRHLHVAREASAEASWGRWCPFPLQHMSLCQQEKNSKNHAADELLKVQLAQVSHKVAGAQDECLFTGTTHPKRFTRTRGSVEKLNMQWNVAVLWVSWRCHKVVIPEWHCIFLVTCWISSRGLILQLQVTWKDGKGFNNACVSLSLNPTYKFFPVMMIQAN